MADCQEGYYLDEKIIFQGGKTMPKRNNGNNPGKQRSSCPNGFKTYWNDILREAWAEVEAKSKAFSLARKHPLRASPQLI